MQCNLDAKGKAVRLVSGVIVALAGIVVLVLAIFAIFTGWWPWAVGVALLAAGALQIYEGRTGWCAIRAMGFKTPI